MRVSRTDISASASTMIVFLILCKAVFGASEWAAAWVRTPPHARPMSFSHGGGMTKNSRKARVDL
jgi:hypothetical protein